MKTKVINFVASPSSGKSLMAALVFSELKMIILGQNMFRNMQKH